MYQVKRSTSTSSLSSSLLYVTITGALAITVWGCAESGVTSSPETYDGEIGKADVTAGPVAEISCDVESSFVRRGSFAKLKVQARDAQGQLSRNYQLTPEPSQGARVVQRDQVIFDMDGQYTVRCCALDTQQCDQVAVRVGELAPALAVSIDRFSEGTTTLKGHAQDRSGQPAQVMVNGVPVESDQSGHFEMRVASPTGLNHYEVLAVGSEGDRSIRHAWTVGGPFNNALDPSAIRLRLGPESYSALSRILTAYFIKLASEASESDELRVTQSGSTLGYHYEVTPTRLGLGDTSVWLERGSRAEELVLKVSLESFQAFADGRTRFAAGAWKDREVLVTANLYIEIPFLLHSQGIEIGQVKTDVEGLRVEISDMPGFIEGILEHIFEREIQQKLVDMIESVGDQGLNGILTRFAFEERVELPEPLIGSLDVIGQVSELQVGSDGVTLGIGLVVDGETDPARQSAPGPLMTSDQIPQLGVDAPYELALHVDSINRILFSAWQTGSLDLMTVIDRPVDDGSDILGDHKISLFVTPALPPIAKIGERPGELSIELGALRLDGILESELAVLNFAVEAGASIRTLLSSDQETLSSSTALEGLTADVLIPPAGWEREPTRELIARLLEKEIAPQYAAVLNAIPIPTADLSSFELSSVNALIVETLSVSTSHNSLTVSAEVELR